MTYYEAYYKACYEAFYAAFMKAIEEHGIEGLKKTSMFGRPRND